jgi:CxxC-x17-CxxC domain-containing protein
MGRFENKGNNKPRNNSFNRGFRNNFEPKEMHDAVCDECKKKCQVPFKPSKDAEGKPRPVYCKECYSKKKPRY